MGFPRSLQVPNNGSQEGKNGCLKTNLVHVASVDVPREVQGDMYDDRHRKGTRGREKDEEERKTEKEKKNR